MKRPLKPVIQTEEERRKERRFTRRMLLLSLAGGLLGAGVQAMTRTMGKPPTPVLPGQRARPEVQSEPIEPPPRLPGK